MRKRALFVILIITAVLTCACSSAGDETPKDTTTIPTTTTPSTTTTPTATIGAVINGSIYYNGSLITEYSTAEAEIALVEVVSWQAISISYQYDNQTGSFTITGVPPGEYTPFIRIESGYPFDVESGGDFTARVSGLNPNIVVSSNTDVINADWAVVNHIHLTSPIDNQERSRAVDDEPDTLYQSQTPSTHTFEWDPVPDAASYRVTIILKDDSTNQSHTIASETITSTTYSVELDTTSGDQYYMFTVNSYNSSDELIGFFQYYYTNGSGGWFKFIVVQE